MSDPNQSLKPSTSEESADDAADSVPPLMSSTTTPAAAPAAGDSTSQEKSPSSSSPPSSSMNNLSGQRLHDKLRTYESQRRLAYKGKFETTTLHWKSYRDLLAASVQETARAQRIVMGTSRAHQLYSDALKAIYEDVFLDDKGNPMLKEKQQKKLYASRKPSNATTRRSSLSGTLRSSSASSGGGGGNGSNSSLVFASVRQAQHVFSDRFGENAKNMDVEIGDEIGRLVEDLKTQCNAMEQLGDAILAELEKTESEVATAWSSYLNMSINEYGSTPGMLPSSNMGGGATPQESSPTNASSDKWVVEMQYRVAVAYQNRAWEMGSMELALLFQSVKHEECRRRMNLRELLVAFVQRQQRLFLSLPPIHNPILEELAELQTNREDIEKEVETAIRDRSLGLRRGTSPGGSLSMGQGIGQATEEEGDFTLESPLNSDLLRRAKVVEIRTPGTPWKTCLGTITGDSYLHFFDLPADRIKLGAKPEAAFYALAPTVIIPSLESLNEGRSNFSKGWSDTITPCESFILAKSVILPKGDTTFDISETVATTGASKMFAKTVTRKLSIKAHTKEEKEEWITVLKTPPD